MMSTRRLMIGAMVLNVYDAAITIYATQRFGIEELNPLMQFCLASSAALFVAVKMLIMSTVYRVILHRHKTQPQAARSVTVGLFLALLAVVVWNTAIVAVILFD